MDQHLTVLCHVNSASPDFSSLPRHASFQLLHFFFYLLTLFLFVLVPAVNSLSEETWRKSDQEEEGARKIILTSSPEQTAVLLKICKPCFC